MMRMSDGVVLVSLGLLLLWVVFVLRTAPERRRWLTLFARPSGAVPALILIASMVVALLDCVPAAQRLGPIQTATMLDALLAEAALGDSGASSNPVAGSLLAQSFKAVRSMWLVGAGGMVLCLPLVLFVGILAGRARGIAHRWLEGVCRAVEAMPPILLMLVLMLLVQAGLERMLVQHAVSAAIASDLRLLIMSVVLVAPTLPRLCLAIGDRSRALLQGDAALGARGLGVGDSTIILHQVLPVAVRVVVVTALLALPGLMLSEVVLSFLGAGLDAHVRSAGTVLADALAIAATDPAGGEVLIAALLPVGTLLASSQVLALALRRAFPHESA